ncbi:MAG TPA: HAMP domain-containing sensor histidine kinase, partial [Saprospiraceae bacterium]|nr:HAMP domain-containing sensor histidine kinase [Saprospiraceae bacterium]
ADLELGLAKERELGELKSRFVSMASHEFRTPLSTILSSVSLIARYTEGEQQPNRDKHIDKIKASVVHLTGILNDFLSMNKLEEGKVDTHFETVDVIDIWNNVIDEMYTILKADQKLINTINIERAWIISDKKILKNIIINLISNAIKYSGEKGEIRCTLDYQDNIFTISIKDNGMGIPKEDQKHLFQRFFRASNAINIEGTGLGLNIVKKYVEMLNGNITFESEHLVGTEFKVRLPTKSGNTTY